MFVKLYIIATLLCVENHDIKPTFCSSSDAASGCSVDWGYATLGAKYSYVVELRDTGNYGFLLPERLIEPSGIETYAAVKALLGHMLEEYFP